MDPKDRRLAIYVGTACACLLLPVLLKAGGFVRSNFDDVVTTYKVSFALGAVGLFAWELKAKLDARAPVLGLLGGALVAMATYGATSRNNQEPFDYQAYVRASDAIADGTDPYIAQRGGYLYPPLLAESVYVLRTGVDKAASLFGTTAKKHLKKSKGSVKEPAAPLYVVWCGLELLGAVLIYALARKLAKRLGADELQATALPVALLLANHAFWRTLANGQINFVLTIVFLVAILNAAQRPFASGLAVAFGTHLKVYPFFLLGPWTLSGRWRITAYALLCFGVIFALQMTFFDPSIWKSYFHFAAGAPQQVRDESLATVSVISYTFGNGKAISFKHASLPAILTGVAYAVVLAVMTLRFFQRELTWRRRRRELDGAAAASVEDKFRIMGHANDAVVLPLLISPIVWTTTSF
jgi:hypothetical protein